MRSGLLAVTRLAGLAAVLIVATACSRGLPAEFRAPDFAVEDLFTGEEIHLAAYQGRPVLLYFFASW